ncbi:MULTISPECIES: hypothetical protein [unclassified Streptomyces]|uniref:hypothetical protein n=1 Tax=unclassified Streptomyces TaxID=2593676 RepID=UPI00081F2DCD|nr:MULTISPECIES: hypothetical protein [unclassified Streptomyces]MYZ33932.1 hypothetical protein [Streptomyces sp. SID4917]SCF62803.1 hypothetical protein GA0115259_1003412 [Streptomyces sp. MnatMP-M17]
MSGQMTPEQVSNLVTIGALILLVVALRITGRWAWNKWLSDVPDDGLTQEERDLRLVQRRGQR